MKRAVLLPWALFTAASVQASPVRVEISASTTPVPAAIARFHVMQQGPGVEKADDVLVQIEAGENGCADLPPGYWSVDIEAPGFWHQRQFVSVNGPSTVVTADLVPSAVIVGHLVAPSPEEMPSRVSIRFANAELKHVRYETGQTDCPVLDKRFQCSMPAGEFDLRVKAPGFIGRTIRGLVLTPGATVDTRETALRRGASILGHVHIPVRDLSPAAVVVRAWPAGVHAEERPGLAAITTAEARCDKNGNFNIEAVPPGRYRLTAVAAKLVCPVYEINAYADLDAEIRTPLELSEPKRLSLALTPPLDPDGGRWHVTLRKSLGPHNLAFITGSDAAASGEWQAQELGPGTYLVDVGMRDATSFVSRTVELSDSILIPVTVDVTRYKGLIRLGEQPVAAASLIIDSDDVSGVQATSDAQGRFEVILPRSSIAPLNVAVRSESPPILRTVSGVVAKDGFLDITLPNTILMGDVANPDGTKAETGLVNISSGPQTAQVKIERDGSFLVQGLAPGSYTMEAYGFLKHSRAVEFELANDPSEGLPPFHLIFADDRKVLGRVYSESGPIAGATVWLNPTDVPVVFGSKARTDAAGEFSLSVPAGAGEADVVIEAPGFARKAVHVTLQNAMLAVKLDQNAGTLQLSNISAGAEGVLLHRGAAEPIAWLMFNWPVTTSGDAQHQVYSVEMMEPGLYSLCVVPGGRNATLQATLASGTARCTNGYLPPFGTLTLAAP